MGFGREAEIENSEDSGEERRFWGAFPRYLRKGNDRKEFD